MCGYEGFLLQLFTYTWMVVGDEEDAEELFAASAVLPAVNGVLNNMAPYPEA